MNKLVIAALSCMVSVAHAEKFKCTVKINSTDASKNKVLWSGEVELAAKKPSGKVMVLNGDGSAQSIDDLTKGADSQDKVKAMLSSHKDKLLFGLTKVDGVLKLSQGYVDASQKNMGPHEALAWSDLKSSKVGTKNIQRELEIECAR